MIYIQDPLKHRIEVDFNPDMKVSELKTLVADRVGKFANEISLGFRG